MKNFYHEKMERVIKERYIKPAVFQVKLHSRFTDPIKYFFKNNNYYNLQKFILFIHNLYQHLQIPMSCSAILAILHCVSDSLFQIDNY